MQPKLKIIYYDGLCALCNKWVSFVLKLDSKQTFYFSSLQSLYAKQHLPAHLQNNNNEIELKSIVFQNGEKFYFQSSAVIFILINLKYYFYPLLLFLLVPPILRDGLYDFIASIRYKIFGKYDSCPLPDKKHEKRFLNE